MPLYFLLGYGFGNLQTSYFIGKVKAGIDIRKHGTNNAGASNVTTVLGFKYGALVALVDILKAFLPMLAAKLLLEASMTQVFFIGFGAIIGHIFPAILRFKGGKGLASLVGLSLGLNLTFGFLLGLMIIIITLITDYIFWGTMSAFFTMWVYVLVVGSLEMQLAASFLLLLSIFKHRINMQRLRAHEEVGLRQVIKKHQR